MTRADEENVLAELRALEPSLGPTAGTDQWSKQVTSLMTSVPLTPEWLSQLVDEFARTHNPEIANSLAFTLAGAANDEQRAQWVAPLAVKAMMGLAVPSPWPRLNLCTMVERLLMFDAMGPALGRPVPGLDQLLISGMEHIDLVQAVVANVTYSLRCNGPFDALTETARAQIEQSVLDCIDSPNEELAGMAKALRDRIAEDQAAGRSA
jgi:hypothetical protein